MLCDKYPIHVEVDVAYQISENMEFRQVLEPPPQVEVKKVEPPPVQEVTVSEEPVKVTEESGQSPEPWGDPGSPRPEENPEYRDPMEPDQPEPM